MIHVATETNNTHPQAILDQNAAELILTMLSEYHPEPWEVSLVDNMRRTIKKHYANK